MINIRPMTVNDCDVVADIHIRAFQGFFLTFLGHEFLKTLYYSIVLDHSGLAIVAEKNNKIVGFVAGTTNQSELYSRLLKKHFLKFFKSAFKGFLKKPNILPRLLRAFSAPRIELPTTNCATLMSIGVDPDYQGQGIGKILARFFITEACSKGSESVTLTTDAINNDVTNHFYESLGFKRYREYITQEGRKMNEYLIQCLPCKNNQS